MQNTKIYGKISVESICFLLKMLWLTSELLSVKQKFPGKLGILALPVEDNGLMKDFFCKSSIKTIHNVKFCIHNGFLIITNLFEIITWSWI